MTTIKIWKGARNVVLSDEYTFVEEEFEGETLGAVEEESDARGVHTTFYRTPDGRIVVHRVNRSRWENEEEYAYVHVFPSLEGVNGATSVFWRELVQAGIIPPRTVSLD